MGEGGGEGAEGVAYCYFFRVLLSAHSGTKDNHVAIVSDPPGCSLLERKEKGNTLWPRMGLQRNPK